MTRVVERSAIALACVLLLAPSAQGQSWRDKLKQAQKKVQSTVEGGEKAGSSATQPAANAAEAAAPSVNVNYDFVPGTRVIFEDDFSHDQVGDLPSRLKPESGSWEVADVGGKKYVRLLSHGVMMIPLPQTLPEKFTLEMDLQHSMGWGVEVAFVPDESREHKDVVEYGWNSGVGNFKSGKPEDVDENHPYHAKLMADGQHVKVYVNGKRVANVPQANLGRSNGIWITTNGDDSRPFYLGNIRIAASDKTLFESLSAEGRAVTHGILFDTNSDGIRPESAPTLKEIGDMLQQHPELKLTIEGHTDNIGAAAANMTLSQKRADAVKQYLVTKFQIDASRLSTKGYGDTKPVAPNTTDEGRQQNRRVELVKL